MNAPRPSFSLLLARLLAVVLAALFVVVGLAVLILFNVERQAFNPATYKRALLNGDFYQQFPLLLGNLLTKELGDSAPDFLKRLTPAEWKNLIGNLLPGQQVEAMTEETLDQVLAYLNGETAAPEISLSPLKQDLQGPAGETAVLTLLRAQPDCTLQLLAAILASPGTGKLCNPPQAVLDLFQPVIQSVLQSTAAAIPDQLVIIPDANSPSKRAGLKILGEVRLIIRLSPLLPLALLLGITILVVRTFKGWLGWWGWPLVWTGLPGMWIGFGGAPLFRAIAERMLSKNLVNDLPPEILTSIRSLVDAALREMLRPAGWEAAGMFALGLIMVSLAAILSILERKKTARSEATTQIL